MVTSRTPAQLSPLGQLFALVAFAANLEPGERIQATRLEAGGFLVEHPDRTRPEAAPEDPRAFFAASPAVAARVRDRLRDLLVLAKEAHTKWENENGPDADWPTWYAAYMAEAMPVPGLAGLASCLPADGPADEIALG